MWIGTFEKLQECSLIGEKTKTSVIEFIKANNMQFLPNGRYELGEGNYVNIFEYETKESDGIFEKHKKYIDIHYVILGSEKVLWAENYMKEIKPYQETGDYSLGEVKYADEVELNGECCVFFPNEPHKAGVILGAVEKVKKAVFKIAISQY